MGGGFKMNFLIFFMNSLETAKKVHTFCELLLTMFDNFQLFCAYFMTIRVFLNEKFTKILPAALTMLKIKSFWVSKGLFHTFIGNLSLKIS